MNLSFKEDHISQIPALQLLKKLGYTYLSPDEALAMRGGKTSKPVTPHQLDSGEPQQGGTVFGTEHREWGAGHAQHPDGEWLHER